MVGSVGNDPFGDFCRDDMTMHGVDISHIKILEGETTFVLCLAEAETQGRSFVGYWGVHHDLTPEEIDEEFIRSARAVHANLSDRFNIRTAFDISIRACSAMMIRITRQTAKSISSTAARLWW